MGTCMEMENGTVTLINRQFLKILTPELPHDSAIPLLGIHSRELKPHAHTNSYTQMFTEAVFIRAKSRNTPNIHQLMNK